MAVDEKVAPTATETQGSAGTAADTAFDFPFAPGFHAAFVSRANCQRLLSNGLKNIELMFALGTNVFVGRHSAALINMPSAHRQEV